MWNTDCFWTYVMFTCMVDSAVATAVQKATDSGSRLHTQQRNNTSHIAITVIPTARISPHPFHPHLIRYGPTSPELWVTTPRIPIHSVILKPNPPQIVGHHFMDTHPSLAYNV